MKLVDPILPFEALIQGDGRMAGYEGRINPDWLQRELARIEIAPDLPESVQHHLRLAAQICVSGFFFYDLFAVAIHEGLVAGEVLLREMLTEDLQLPIEFSSSKRGRAHSPFPERPSAKELFWQLSAPGVAVVVEGKKVNGNFASLVEWAQHQGYILDEDRDWWENERRMRNTFAHGVVAILPPSNPLGSLRSCVDKFNGTWARFTRRKP